VFSYMCVNSFCMCIVFSVVTMSFSGLHSVTDIRVCDIMVVGGINPRGVHLVLRLKMHVSAF
jgi:hypothetical protein